MAGNLLWQSNCQRVTCQRSVSPPHRTLLHAAAAGGNLALFQYLISKGAGSSILSADEEVRYRYLRIIKRPNGASHGFSRIFAALTSTWCKFLLQSASISFCNLQDWTPLHSAVSAGHTEIVQALISGGADVNAANSSGQTALHYAVSFVLLSCCG